LRTTLVENDITDNSTTPLQTVNLGPVDTGTNTGSVAFNSIKQDWQWMDDVTFLVTAPFTKNFVYTVELNAQDPWGNQYQANSPQLSVAVSVPPWKIGDENGAIGSASLATSLTAAAAIALAAGELIVAGGLFTAAGIAYATAQAVAASAKDPPEADRSYRDVVQTKSVEIPSQLSGSPTLNALAALFSLLLEIASDHEAVSVVEGRILGASMASDRDALDRQVVRHAELTKHMKEITLEVPVATSSAIQTSRTDARMDPAAIRNTLTQWKRTGVPQEIRTAWLAQNLPEGTFLAIERVIREVPIEILTVPIQQQLASMSLRIANWAVSAGAQRSFGLRE
jgi:hypothetical protein